MYNMDLSPKSRDGAIIKGDKWRFTILTDRLVRIEWAEDGVFEDRATQVVIDRDFDVPEYVINEDRDDFIKITTKNVEITYTKSPFTKYSFCIKKLDDGGFYYYDDTLWGSLPGTAKTLDVREDNVELEGSIMGGWFNVIDDSKSAILHPDGWVSAREDNTKVDRYIFAYGSDHIGALKDFYKLTGKTPLLPRFALGNWWSRYHKYTQQEYKELMERFQSEKIPFSVAVIDMDWHNVDIDKKYGSGWTGYTWNRDLIPEPKDLLKYLNDNHLKVTLNLHPADGIKAHEEMYLDMAKELGVDYENEERIAFDITNPKFAKAYFKYLLHPLEEDGVAFWWMDWQQGDSTYTEGVTPLWMLAHLHYMDNCRNGKRGLSFSRYAGVGSHRYPVGFSGDAIISWKALNYQPYFTATASNIGYTWWSHDIGGHAAGYRDEELQVRWVQLGVFSPIMRLHSCPGPFTRKEPWTYSTDNNRIISENLRLRHALIPYLYTMNKLTSDEALPLIRPMYYHTNGSDDTKNEFYYGTEMIAAPITSPMDNTILMGSSTAWLPEGDWYDFFTGKKYKGGHKYKAYRTIDTIPVFVKAGGIIPMAEQAEHINDVSNPENLLVRIFPGADNTFKMYEDDGETFEYKNGAYADTTFSLSWGDKVKLSIKAEGDLSVIPANRTFKLSFENIANADSIKISQGKKAIEYTDKAMIVTISDVDISKEIEVEIEGAKIAEFDSLAAAIDILCRAKTEHGVKGEIYFALNAAKSPMDAIAGITGADIPKELSDALIECYL